MNTLEIQIRGKKMKNLIFFFFFAVHDHIYNIKKTLNRKTKHEIPSAPLTYEALRSHQLQSYFICQDGGVSVCDVGERTGVNEHRSSLWTHRVQRSERWAAREIISDTKLEFWVWDSEKPEGKREDLHSPPESASGLALWRPSSAQLKPH